MCTRRRPNRVLALPTTASARGEGSSSGKPTAGGETAENAAAGAVVSSFCSCPDDEFRLSRRLIRCPRRGPYYSLNEAREPDWPDGLRRWVQDARNGDTPASTKYSSRYVCSLVADFHRTLLKGGWAGNPRPRLRLLHEAAPLAFVARAAGGTGSDGIRNLLDVCPAAQQLHQRTCVFFGSVDDVDDLVVKYGDVQQDSKRYRA